MSEYGWMNKRWRIYLEFNVNRFVGVAALRTNSQVKQSIQV